MSDMYIYIYIYIYICFQTHIKSKRKNPNHPLLLSAEAGIMVYTCGVCPRWHLLSCVLSGAFVEDTPFILRELKGFFKKCARGALGAGQAYDSMASHGRGALGARFSVTYSNSTVISYNLQEIQQFRVFLLQFTVNLRKCTVNAL